MHLPVAALMWSLLLGGWTFIWLTWSFDADVRSWIAALTFPSKWRGGIARGKVAAMSPSAFTTWLIRSSYAPQSLCQLMSCYRCWSAHVAGVGALIILSTGALPPLVVPLVWACGAAIGNIIYAYLKRTN